MSLIRAALHGMSATRDAGGSFINRRADVVLWSAGGLL